MQVVFELRECGEGCQGLVVKFDFIVTMPRPRNRVTSVFISRRSPLHGFCKLYLFLTKRRVDIS